MGHYLLLLMWRYLFPIQSTETADIEIFLPVSTLHMKWGNFEERKTLRWELKKQKRRRTLKQQCFLSVVKQHKYRRETLFHKQDGFQLRVLYYIPFKSSLFLLVLALKAQQP